jgi:hypothetical protein
VPETVVSVASVGANETRSGNTRYVLVDTDGNEYTTFREAIARAAKAAEGKRARLTYHEETRGRFRNVYLDGVEVVGAVPGADPDDHEVEEVAWKTAIDAAPWLLGGEPTEPVDDEDLFQALQPFKERVADDIRDGESERLKPEAQ